MKLSRSFAVVIFLSTLFSASCGKTAPPASSSAGALTANSALNSAARPFGRHTLNSGGAGYLNEFIRPEVRARLDEEPGGDADGGFDPSTVDAGTSSGQSPAESGGEAQNEEAPEPRAGDNDEGSGPRVDTLKFSWAKKAFGDAVKVSPTNNGVIVLYADENYYDVDRLMGLVQEGRNRITENSAIPGDRIQVVFGGYRAAPQVELWVVPQGGPMPEFKTEERPKPAQPEN
ncbi:MAG TPA: hypothetical protein VMZ26_02370 [Pyrinomonadaceae bacterium]|nr:hypothetical protein [Pyrinomonadaceae bacterium]